MLLTSEGLVWLGATVLLGLVGWFKSINVVLILAYTMAALQCLNGWIAARQVRRVLATRESHPPVYAGESAVVRVTVTNQGRRAATVRIEDRAGAESIGWFVHRLPAGTSTLCTSPRVFSARGRFASSLEVSSTLPLGLIHAGRAEPADSELIVLPAPGEADANGLRQWLLRQTGGDGWARKVLRRVTSDQADVRGVRPYRPGDPIRGIHWRSSARRGELMVREYDAAPSPELVLVVEPWLPDEPTATERANLEAALSLAVTIARAWSRVFETHVTIAVAGEPDSVSTASATDSSLKLALAPLASVAGGCSFGPLGPSDFERSLQRSARLVVSSRRNSPYATALTRSTGRPFQATSPTDRPAWYESPATAGKNR